jgi:uncharacterized protein (DUF169 family)
MNPIRLLENRTGVRWTGIRFHREVPRDMEQPARPMCFCEAVNISCTMPVTLTPAVLNCPGAQRSFGWSVNGDASLLEKWMAHLGLASDVARNLLPKIPRIEDHRIGAVTVGTYQSPDLLLAYLQPDYATRFVLQWQNAHRDNLDICISSIMAVCGNVAADAFISGRIRCSFGCSAASAHGFIGRDRLIFGLPAGLIDAFI